MACEVKQIGNDLMGMLKLAPSEQLDVADVVSSAGSMFFGRRILYLAGAVEMLHFWACNDVSVAMPLA